MVTGCFVRSQAIRTEIDRSVQIATADFKAGSLGRPSFVRVAKLFTAHESLIFSEIGILREESMLRIIDAVVKFVRSSN